MRKRFTAVISGEERSVAHCVELGVVSQGKTIEEAKSQPQRGCGTLFWEFRG